MIVWNVEIPTVQVSIAHLKYLKRLKYEIFMGKEVMLRLDKLIMVVFDLILL